MFMPRRPTFDSAVSPGPSRLESSIDEQDVQTPTSLDLLDPAKEDEEEEESVGLICFQHFLCRRWARRRLSRLLLLRCYRP